MASTIIPNQIRINDPYQQTTFQWNTVDSKHYISRESNKLLNVIGKDIVLKGMEMENPVILSPSTIQVTITPGWAIHDQTLIELTSSATVDLDAALLDDTVIGGAHLAVFLNYKYLETIEPNFAAIDIFHVAADGTVYNPFERFSTEACRILLGIIDFTKSGSTVIVASISARTTLLVEGSIFTFRGWSADNINIPNFYSSADDAYLEEWRIYLLKRDYVFME